MPAAKRNENPYCMFHAKKRDKRNELEEKIRPKI